MKRFLWGFFLFASALLLAFALLWGLVPLSLEQVELVDRSPALYDSKGQLFHLRLSPDSEWLIPIPLSEMGRWLPIVAVAVEDGRFYQHPGVDLLAILRASFQNLTEQRVVSGASTISSQVVRLTVSERELLPGQSRWGRRPRTFSTKIREFIQALKLERLMSKEKILETYLNRAPFGGNLRGVQAASLVYFGKTASQLSPGEAALMIGMLKGPTLYRPDTRPEAARRRRDTVIRFLEDRGVFSHTEAQRALMEVLPHKKYSPPLSAYHFSEMVLDRPSSKSGINTSLNLELQTKLEAILRSELETLPPDITIAAGVVDNRTAGLTAWVGNARFGSGVPGSWVDCGQGLRSPGSTLKPFAYLSAFDQGILTPPVLLGDSPLAFSGRAPRNFDLSYRGAVSVRVALADSLNAPAVRVLRLAAPERVLQLMREFGLRSLKENSSYYGDSLILGGCDVTLLQMLEAYTALASQGMHRPLALTQEEARENNLLMSRQLASPEACWLVSDILDNRGRLSAFTRETLGQGWHVAFKTGTSYGLRDAWTAAWTPDYTVVVWVGNPDGSSWSELIGVRAAAPIAIRILRNFSPQSTWYSKPEGLTLQRVCSLSGLPPTAVCPSTRLDWGIEGVSRTVPCSLHVLRGGQKTVLWPSELSTRQTPQTQLKKRPTLSITSPIQEALYLLAPLARNRKIPMRAEGASERLWWFLNGIYVGSSLPNETFFHDLEDGTHLISVSDNEGRSDAVRVRVASPGKRTEAPLLQ
ncbi:MAG: penicillin-binding protein 1C [Fretibacterium sp.]|nr:penicillin-binding protein 1C [Fretibacterium sp.]